MGSWKELDVPPFSMPAHFMSKYSGPRLYVCIKMAKFTLKIVWNYIDNYEKYPSYARFFNLINALQGRFPNQHT